MVLGLKPIGKLITLDNYFSVTQNQGLAWSSDSNLWGIVRDHAPGPLLWDVGPNPHEWVESCYCLSKWRFD